MDKQRLAEIKKLLEYTPDGPWDIDHYADDNDLVTDIWIDGEDCGHIEVYGDTAESSIYTAFFIKHARQDVPELVAEVERLRKSIEDVQSHLFTIRGLDAQHDSEITGICIKLRQILNGDFDD